MISVGNPGSKASWGPSATGVLSFRDCEHREKESFGGLLLAIERNRWTVAPGVQVSGAEQRIGPEAVLRTLQGFGSGGIHSVASVSCSISFRARFPAVVLNYISRRWVSSAEKWNSQKIEFIGRRGVLQNCNDLKILAAAGRLQSHN